MASYAYMYTVINTVDTDISKINKKIRTKILTHKTHIHAHICAV